MITQRNASVANRSRQKKGRDQQASAEMRRRKENPDLLFNRVTLGMIRYERRKRRGRSVRRFLFFFLVLAGLCGAWAYYLGDPRTFDWVGLWQRVPWPFDQTS